MQNFEPIVNKISDQLGAIFRPASPFELAKLESLGLPEPVLAFYRDFEPFGADAGQIRLWPIEHILEENEAAIPGCYSSQQGYVVFASTFCGDAYCFDIRPGADADPPIVLISHEIVNESTTTSELNRIAKPVARNLSDFLQRFLRGDVDEDCIY